MQYIELLMTPNKWVDLGAGSQVTSDQPKIDCSNNARVNEIFWAKGSSMLGHKRNLKCSQLQPLLSMLWTFWMTWAWVANCIIYLWLFPLLPCVYRPYSRPYDIYEAVKMHGLIYWLHRSGQLARPLWKGYYLHVSDNKKYLALFYLWKRIFKIFSSMIFGLCVNWQLKVQILGKLFV